MEFKITFDNLKLDFSNKSIEENYYNLDIVAYNNIAHKETISFNNILPSAHISSKDHYYNDPNLITMAII
ncbi:MAG: hypothetical protein ACK4OM_02280 [Alphaproteobacteria bacterium]